MNRILAAAALAAALPLMALATPQTVPDGNGGWKENPECTGSCQSWNKEPAPPDRPRPGPPQRVEKERPNTTRTSDGDGNGKDRAARRFWCLAPDGRVARVNGAPLPIPPALRACGWQIHAKGKGLGQW